MNSENNNIVTDQQKETCAILVMRSMLEIYSEKHNISFSEALERFANSPIYDGLFDFDTGLWAEGPDYLLSFYE